MYCFIFISWCSLCWLSIGELRMMWFIVFVLVWKMLVFLLSWVDSDMM